MRKREIRERERERSERERERERDDWELMSTYELPVHILTTVLLGNRGNPFMSHDFNIVVNVNAT